MSDVNEIETRRIAESFRPSFRPLLMTVLANALLAALLLGVPYVRGRAIASSERPAFARLARCLLGGEPSDAPGLGLPKGEREHFADQVLFAKRDWPLSCRSNLQALMPPDAIFLWPSVKEAGADLRAVLRLLDTELAALHRKRLQSLATIPARPLLALSKVQAALTLMAQATGLETGIDNEALRFASQPILAVPARLPLFAAQDATLDLSMEAGVLDALSLDGRGVSWLHMDSGQVDHERVKRGGLVRAVLRAGTEPYLVFATPRARCQERKDRCAGRATGIAAYDKGAHALPAPFWLQGHPAARPDRAMQVSSDGQVTLLALGDGGQGLVLRRFHIDTHSAAVADAAPIEPAQSWPVTEASGVLDALLLPGEPMQVAYAEQDGEEIKAELVAPGTETAPVTLPGLKGVNPFVVACGSGAARFLGVGSDSGLRLFRSDGTAGVSELGMLEARIETPLHPDNPALDRLRLLCTEDALRVFLLDADATLSVSVCDAKRGCVAKRKLAARVAAFSLTSTDNVALVAFSGVAPAREIRILRLDARGQALGPALPAAACWEPASGMCGVPKLLRDGPRVLLTARDGGDLLAIESNDAGQHFTTLSGLQMGRALDPSMHDPLEQHRIRKGLH